MPVLSLISGHELIALLWAPVVLLPLLAFLVWIDGRIAGKRPR